MEGAAEGPQTKSAVEEAEQERSLVVKVVVQEHSSAAEAEEPAVRLSLLEEEELDVNWRAEAVVRCPPGPLAAKVEE